jgi:hypothetical protein
MQDHAIGRSVHIIWWRPHECTRREVPHYLRNVALMEAAEVLAKRYIAPPVIALLLSKVRVDTPLVDSGHALGNGSDPKLPSSRDLNGGIPCLNKFGSGIGTTHVLNARTAFIGEACPRKYIAPPHMARFLRNVTLDLSMDARVW